MRRIASAKPLRNATPCSRMRPIRVWVPLVPIPISRCRLPVPPNDGTMRPMNARPRRPILLAALGLLLCAFCAALLLTVGSAIVRQHRVRVRGVEQSPRSAAIPWGVNVALERYDAAEAHRALALIRDGGFRWIRQRFRWDEIEPERAAYRWQACDQWVALAAEHDLALIAVLEGSPPWARSPADAANPSAPPQDARAYAEWAAQVATRYRDRIAAYQIWDGPNIWPNCGHRGPDPAGYAQLLSAAYAALKKADPQALVVAAGLAPTVEQSARNLSDVAYLQAMYGAGAAPWFDILAAKPYGFWSGPEDRRVDEGLLNFSRLILLREEMVRRGDGHKPIWAVEMGWNALPPDWSGPSPPWGTDEAAKQADRTLRALIRARAEWPWLGVICLQHFQPAAAPDDPLWGFALVDRDLRPLLLYDELRRFFASPESDPAPYAPPVGALRSSLALLAAGLATVAWRGAACARRLPWVAWWRWGEETFRRLSDGGQALCVGLTLGVYLLSPNHGLALLGLWLLLVLSYWRLEWTLLLATFAIPFTPFRRPLGSLAFSPIESLTIVCIAAWALQIVRRLESAGVGLPRSRADLRQLGRQIASCVLAVPLDWRGLDGAWAFFVATAIGSLLVSRHLAVSLRELRTTVLEPALFYLLITRHPSSRPEPQSKRLILLADALVFAGAALSAQGLWQYFGGDAIVAEGVRRVRGIYASPNNLSLVLGRILPLAIALAWQGQTRWRRIAYAITAALMLSCLFLTFSRGAWLLGLPAALLFLAAMHGRRAAWIAVAAVVVAFLALIPVAGTERIASLLDPTAGTTLFRLSLWKSALAMIRDHPLAGIGLDNFLYYYRQYILPEAAAEPNLSHPHNLVLDFWLRLGLGGLGVLAWFAAGLVRRGVHLIRRLRGGDLRSLTLGLLTSGVYAVAHGLVDNAYFIVELAFLWALTTGLLQRLRLGKEERA